MNVKAKRITTIAMLCALAYVVMAVGRVPVVLFLKYDPKDVVITLGGLIWGPMTGLHCLGSRLRSGDVHCQRHGHSGLYHEHSVHLRLCLHRLRHLPEKAHAGRGCRRVGRRMRGDGQRHAAVELPHYAPLHGIPPGGGCGAAAPRLSPLQSASRADSMLGITFLLYKPVDLLSAEKRTD